MATAPKSRTNPGPNRPPATPRAALPARKAEAKGQIGARVAEAKYRHLKLAAVLRGVRVQTIIEQAIEEFLTNHRNCSTAAWRPKSPRNHRRAGRARWPALVTSQNGI
jgi:hypothetical protein